MKKKLQFLYFILWSSVFATGGTLVVLAGFYLYLSPQLPSIDSLRDIRYQIPLRIYSADNKLIGEFGEKRRTPVKVDEIPQNYINALLAAEDDQFYKHNGVSFRGLMRATTQLAASGRIQSGGSTITMQVARNFFLSRRQTFARKFNEILLALKIERELTKDEILELYVNVIFLGHRAYGIAAAAQVYYGKPLNELSLAQLAMIAGLPKAPSIYNPVTNPERSLTRRDWILGRMLTLEKINEQQYQDAINEPDTAKLHGTKLDVNASYIAEMARKQAIQKFGLSVYTEGYEVFTTVNSNLQKAAQEAVSKGLISYDSRHGYRGPEHSLLTTTDPSEEVTAATPEQIEEWINYISDIPSYGKLAPAVVTNVGEKDLTATFADGQQATIFWEQGLSSARPYLSENSLGPKPQSASEIAKLGDVIRLEFEADKGWKLSQIPAAQAALVALNPHNGAILSLVGGFDFRHSHFNRATQAKRQPGSNFKPFIYTAALENGMTPATIINDAPIVFADDQLESTWRPENDSGKFYGPTRLRKALYLSRNLVSIRVLRSIGINNAINTVEKFGFKAETLPKDLSLSLGSHAVTPLNIAQGYAVFANRGYQVEPYLINKIVDLKGNTVFEQLPLTACQSCEELPSSGDTLIKPIEASIDQILSSPEETEEPDLFAMEEDVITPPFKLNFEVKKLIGTLEPEDYPRAPKILSDQVAYIIDDMLKDVIKRGTGRRAKKLGRNDLAGKTGTTNGPTDAWFSGYNKDVVATTWVGFDQNTPLGRREYGGSAALPIWIDFMETALKNKPSETPLQPEGVVTVRIDPETGKRARSGDPDAIFEIFRRNNVPEELEETALDAPWEAEQTLQEELF